MKTITLNFALALLLFSCLSEDDLGNLFTNICRHVEMTIPDPADPIKLIIDSDDDGNVTSLQGSSGAVKKLDVVLQYDTDGLLENVISKDVEIKIDDTTKMISSLKIGDVKVGPGQLFSFRNDQIFSCYVINGDKEGLETVVYTYDDDGNATTVEAKLIDETKQVKGTYVVEFTYDRTHEAVFANAPFLQAYTTLSAYLLPFGLTNKNLISTITITFNYESRVAQESRDINYTFNDQGMVTSLTWSNNGGKFKTDFAYDCD